MPSKAFTFTVANLPIKLLDVLLQAGTMSDLLAERELEDTQLRL
jgi:hypothetical protein